ncbi:hypothetical protein [Ensifer sp. B1-9]|uniref:hypothetical protein n=1 Tax=Ensifer sp. B1-9 TaxID=3141455 RepID=UPI003D220CF3
MAGREITPAEAAEILGIDLDLLERRVRARRLLRREINGKITFSLAEVLSLREDEDRKLVDSCKDQLMDIRSSAFANHFPYYSPTELEKFAGMGTALDMPLGGFPSAALDNYEFDATAWNLERSKQGISDHDDLIRCRRSGGWLLRSAVCSRLQLRAGRPQGQRTKVFYLD